MASKNKPVKPVKPKFKDYRIEQGELFYEYFSKYDLGVTAEKMNPRSFQKYYVRYTKAIGEKYSKDLHLSPEELLVGLFFAIANHTGSKEINKFHVVTRDENNAILLRSMVFGQFKLDMQVLHRIRKIDPLEYKELMSKLARFFLSHTESDLEEGSEIVEDIQHQYNKINAAFLFADYKTYEENRIHYLDLFHLVIPKTRKPRKPKPVVIKQSQKVFLLDTVNTDNKHLAKLEEGVDAWNTWISTQDSEFTASLDAVNCENEKLQGVNLSNAYLRKAVFEGANLTKANLEGAEMSGAYFQGATLFGTNFQKATLICASFIGKDTNFQKVNFMGANLEEADFSNTELQKVNFMGANLKNTNFTGANLSGADLRYTKSQDSAIFVDVILDDVTYDNES